MFQDQEQDQDCTIAVSRGLETKTMVSRTTRLATAYRKGQIIKPVCVCQSQSVSVRAHSHGRISWSIFTKIGTDVRTPKVKTSLLGVNIAPPLPQFYPQNLHFRPMMFPMLVYGCYYNVLYKFWPLMTIHTLVSTRSWVSTFEGLYLWSNLAQCWQYKKKRKILDQEVLINQCK